MLFTLLTAVFLLASVYYVVPEDRWSPDDVQTSTRRIAHLP